jgi:hypothetical protein
MTSSTATSAEIGRALAELDSWTVADGKLHREYQFRDFVQAFGFMAQVALLAERANHHPEMSTQVAAHSSRTRCLPHLEEKAYAADASRLGSNPSRYEAQLI